MSRSMKYGPRFNGGSVAQAVTVGSALTSSERAAFRRLRERQAALREEDPAAFARLSLKTKQRTSMTKRRHVPVSLAPVRGLEGC